MTYRERREARADRLEEWADKREEKAAAVFEANRPYTSDYAFNTQPGHIPARARIIRQEDRARESLRKASDMRRRAGGIADQLDSSIYDDDPDAVERLEERLAELEAKRERIRQHNKEHRGNKLCPCPAECDCRSRFPRDCDCNKHPLPAYVLQNLGGNIKRNRDRLEVIKRQRARTAAAEEAGGTVVEQLGHGYARVTFAEKPAREVLDRLKAAGYRWAKGSWIGKAEDLPELPA